MFKNMQRIELIVELTKREKKIKVKIKNTNKIY